MLTKALTRCWSLSIQTVLSTFALAACLCPAPTFAAAETPDTPGTPTPPARQDVFVQKYCAVCHTDAVPSGGLTLQYFHAATADPSLVAMLLSKIKSGALGAAGLPLPDAESRRALVSAFTAGSALSHEWHVEQTQAAPLVTAGIARRVPSTRSAGEPALYRLTLSCNTETRAG